MINKRGGFDKEPEFFYTCFIRPSVSWLHSSSKPHRGIVLIQTTCFQCVQSGGQQVSHHSIDGNPENKWNEEVIVDDDSDGIDDRVLVIDDDCQFPEMEVSVDWHNLHN